MNPSVGRKSSISQSHLGTLNTASSGPGRGNARRRDASDSYTNPMSPTGTSRFFRDEPSAAAPPAALLRRKTDFKDDAKEKEKDKDRDDDAFGLKRATSNQSAGLNVPASPWSTTGAGAGFGFMGGSFGSFGMGSSDAPEPRSGFGSIRGESRFKGLLPKTSSEDIAAREKSSVGNLGKLAEVENDDGYQGWDEGLRNRPGRSDTNPYGDDLQRSRHDGDDQSSFLNNPLNPNISHDNFHQTPHTRRGQEPMSPTDTNPYQSPENDRREDPEAHRNFAFGSRDDLRRGMTTSIEDRSQTSSAGPGRAFGGLGGLGGFPGFASSAWSAGGTPNPGKDGGLSGLRDPVFGGDMQPSNLGSLGGNFLPSPIGQAPGARSKMSSFFPPPEPRREPEPQADFATRSRGITGLDNAFGRRDEHRFDAGSQEEPGREAIGAFGQPLAYSSQPIGMSAGPGAPEAPPQPSETPTSSLPAAQQRQMVMPDRMRWIYRDPSGNTQGPWSGLEMHDWFKAGFFTAELQVKKLEDTEYEPLAQLVRRIGNSREPFLVPQIGVPHGPPGPAQGNMWSAGGPVPPAGPGQPGATQPPFASSFPSFGTTLTAEQQNALERRKQEEQYLMARQKEHLAQQQVLLKQMQLSGPHSMHSLQHHSSAHSLHSQPSFGSITSPSGYQPSPSQGPMQGPIQPPQPGPFMENQLRSQYSGDFRRDDELSAHMDRMNVSRGGPFPFPAGFNQQDMPPPQMGQMMQDRARLQLEQQQADSESQGDAFREGQAFDERLREFTALRAQTDADEANALPREPAGLGLPGSRPDAQSRHEVEQASLVADNISSMTSSQQSQGNNEANAWGKPDSGLPAFLPPPPSASPLPAPAAQRNRQNVADNLVAESRSQASTPIETPSTSVAPWADKTAEHTKGPSLKEIQEAEARKAAQREELAAAARKAQAEQDRLAQSQAPPPQPGLPSTSTWGSASATPITPTNPAANVWAKAAGKPASATTTSKKSIAQIQKEEEARKQRAAAQAAQQAAPGSQGKRYADLASKSSPAQPLAPSGAWTTVGSGGKAKAPAAVVATPQTTTRTTATATRARPAVTTRTSTTNASAATNLGSAAGKGATEDVARWAKGALGKGLNGNINGESERVQRVRTMHD